MTDREFEGRVGLVTGAGWGIGLAVARRLVDGGAVVVLTDIDGARVAAAAASLGAPDRVTAVRADSLDPADAARAVDEAVARFGRLDLLVNNVGGRGTPPGLEADTTQFELELDLCITTGFLMTQAAAPVMIDQGGGAVVFVSSSAGRYTSDMAGVGYCAGKAGVLALSRAVASELGRHGIRSNCVAPGSTLTEQGQQDWDDLPESERARIQSAIPLGRLAEPGDIADAVVFLLSERARYVTGVTIDVNGGYLMS